MATVHAASARILLQYCEDAGLDSARMLRRAGVERALLEDHEARIPLEANFALWEWLTQRSSDPDLGLRVAQAVRPGSFRLPYFLMAHSDSVGSALEQLCAFSRWLCDAVHFRVIHAHGRIGLALGPASGAPCGGAAQVEFTLLSCLLGVRRATGLTVSPEQVELTYAPITGCAPRERAFGCRVALGASENRLWFSPKTWQEPVPRADPALLDILEEHTRSRLSSLSTDAPLVVRVKSVLLSELHDGSPSVERVARALGTSCRALQRSLLASGSSYSSILDSTRKEAAERLLSDERLSLAEVALRLGFSEQSAFTRAYKRWYGEPPNRARRAVTSLRTVSLRRT